MKLFLFILFSMLSFIVHAQKNIRGIVLDISQKNKTPIEGATIYSIEEPTKYALTDASGNFSINLNEKTKRIVTQYINYYSDTLELEPTKTFYEVRLTQKSLKEITINGASTSRNMDHTLNMENIGLKEIRSAACCNLSEAFEKNASVDVIYSDAISGAKEIKMLGLDGYYTQVLVGNQTAIRGLNNTFGLQYIPGQWMKGISVTKGIGSVVNGYESITGQINVENKKPWNSDIFSLNFFGTHQGYLELNADFSYRLSDKTSTIALIHGETHPLLNDFNKDGFSDHPRYWQSNIANIWKYSGEKFEADFGAQVIIENRDAGQLSYLKNQQIPNSGFGIAIDNRRYEVFAKTGFIFSEDKSLGIQYKFFRHEQSAFFGNNDYKGVQHFGNINMIYQTEILHHDNILRFGASYTYDDYNEKYNTLIRKRREHVPGLFAEYSYKYLRKIDLILGLRVDYNSYFGTFVSPRIHFKYSPREDIGIRLSAGKGYRSPNIFAENMSIFTSSRSLEIAPNLSYESAWNYGISISKKFLIRSNKELVLSVDLYRTDFQKQLVADREDVNKIRFYNLDGKSFANSLQLEVSYEILPGFTTKIAWKYDDVWVQYQDGLKRKPLLPIYKLLGNLNYTTKNKKWMFNLTCQYYSKARIPNTEANSEAFRLAKYSKGYINLLSQINYFINKRFEVYLGGENILNYMQPNAIIDAQNPFGNNFDASLIYGPVDGIRIYAGFRYNLPYAKGDRKK